MRRPLWLELGELGESWGNELREASGGQVTQGLEVPRVDSGSQCENSRSL